MDESMKTRKLKMGDKLTSLEIYLKQLAAQREERRKKEAEIRQMEATGDYTNQFIEAQRKKLPQVDGWEVHQKLLDLTNDLLAVMAEGYDAPIDLSDGELQAALNLVNIAGGNLGFTETAKMVAQFAGNPPALKALKSVFEAKGMTQGAEEAAKWLYEPVDAEETFGTMSHAVAHSGGSLNEFARRVNAFTSKDGKPFPAQAEGGLIDQAGADMAIRKAAGLPE